MKKLILFIPFALAPVLTFGQNKQWYKPINIIRYLGLSGNRYWTEVPISISQIRYQDGQNMPVFKDYSVEKYNVTIDKGLLYFLYSDPATATPLLSPKPCVGFLYDESTYHDQPYFVPTTKEPLPTSGGKIVRIDSCAAAYGLDYRKYLFVPAGGKMPLFGQRLRDKWFVSGPISLTFRHRQTIEKNGLLPELSEDFAAPSLSIGIVTGSQHVLNRGFGRSYKSPIIYQVPLFMLGISSIKALLPKASNAAKPDVIDSYALVDNKACLTFATGVGFQFGSFAITPMVGWDFLLGADAHNWPYQRKIWWGGSFGVSLEKLVGLVK